MRILGAVSKHVDFSAFTFILHPEHEYLFSPVSLSAFTYYYRQSFSPNCPFSLGICIVREQFSVYVLD